jgi:hypothetical protein
VNEKHDITQLDDAIRHPDVQFVGVEVNESDEDIRKEEERRQAA